MNEPLPEGRPYISVIILNYNGLEWLSRCYASIEKQTVFSKIEVILTDNNSADSSVAFTNEWIKRSGVKGRIVQNGANLYYCEANNNGAAVATGEFLLFLNNDTWLEPDCLEKLYAHAISAQADCVAPNVLNYDDNSFQGSGAGGLDWFGMPTAVSEPSHVFELFSGYGCSLLVRAEMFRKIGGFANELLIYADESDLSWRIWIAGGKILTSPTARLHHRGSAVVNPMGNTKVVEMRTSDTKRYLTNRNGLLLLLKNCQHLLLILVVSQLFLLMVEALVVLLMVRRWSYVRKAYVSALVDVFRMRRQVLDWRRRIKGFRQRSDFWMCRFLCVRPSRWAEIERLFKFGKLKVDER